MDAMKPMDSMEKKADHEPTLNLARANVPATIPMHQGYFDGGEVYFIITDSSDETHANVITENQGWKVELAPLLANTPDAALSTTYMFTNGVEGDGVHGYQGEVFTSTPAQPDVYSALTSHVHTAHLHFPNRGRDEYDQRGRSSMHPWQCQLSAPILFRLQQAIMVHFDPPYSSSLPRAETVVFHYPVQFHLSTSSSLIPYHAF